MACGGWEGKLLRRGREGTVVEMGLPAVHCLPLAVVQPHVVVGVA